MTKTIDEYQRHVDQAISADRRTLKSLSLARRLQVLLLRQRIAEGTLSRLKGCSVFVYAVERDRIAKDSVGRTTLGTVNVAGTRATTEVLIGRQTAPHRFQFASDDGAWWFDLAELLQTADQVLRAAANRAA